MNTTPIYASAAEDGSATLVIGTSGKGKSAMPDNSELTMALATQAFDMIGHDDFKVSANLSIDNPKSLKNFGMLQSILLMAYKQGVLDAQEGKVKIGANSALTPFSGATAAEAEAVLANTSSKVGAPPRD